MAYQEPTDDKSELGRPPGRLLGPASRGAVHSGHGPQGKGSTGPDKRTKTPVHLSHVVKHPSHPNLPSSRGTRAPVSWSSHLQENLKAKKKVFPPTWLSSTSVWRRGMDRLTSEGPRLPGLQPLRWGRQQKSSFVSTGSHSHALAHAPHELFPRTALQAWLPR